MVHYIFHFKDADSVAGVMAHSPDLDAEKMRAVLWNAATHYGHPISRIDCWGGVISEAMPNWGPEPANET